MLLHLLLIFHLLILVKTEHFMGGSIGFSSSSSSTTFKLSIVQTYLWTYDKNPCVPSQQSIKFPSNYGLTCAFPSSASISPKFIPISPISCIDANIALDVSVTQITMTLRVSQNDQLNCNFRNSSWRNFMALNYGSKPIWSFSLKITNLNRSDGTINSSPRMALVSPLVIISANQPQIISIPVIDQDNDIVQCRFANTSAECGDACVLNTLLKFAILLNNCTLIIPAYQLNGWYPVSIQVEDFLPSNSIPLSSTPFQFLINIRRSSSLSCKQPPLLNSNIPTFIQNVTINIPFTFQLNASITCSTYKTISVDSILSFALLNIVKGPLVRISKSQKIWTMTVWWTPTSQQIGLQLLCMVAIDRFDQ